LVAAWDELSLREKYSKWEFCYEHIVFFDDVAIAGQADLVLFDHAKQQFIIFDYKTNKKGIKFNSFNNKMMFEPYDMLSDCNYNHYMLQLNYYSRFIKKETGYRCKRLALLWIDTSNPNRVEINPIEIPLFQVFL
jgi:ATP-dependent exoDNAse (exonuclease V) beta subunit